MKSIRLLALIIISGLFYFSEGKPCPEKSQPHKTRCDVYFKCVMLPSKTHAWIPEKCEQGLIYEPNLGICVLPGDDWECNMGELGKDSDDDNKVFGSEVEVLSRSFDEGSDDFVKIETAKESEESEEIDDEENDEDNDSEYITVDNESDLSERDFESSGDGGGDYILVNPLPPQQKTSEADLPEVTSPTKIDPNLTAHLQRLTQLIDGLKQTYQNKESSTATDLRPDQLNAFLAHYNIKAQLNSIDPASEETTPKIERNQSTEVDSSTTPSSQLDPETKVILTNHLPNSYNTARPSDGYSNSQIVVNKPEGSVLFTLGNQPQDTIIDRRYDPKISEDTLKTVLELSKQMLDNQDLRRVIPSTAYYPQVVQPIYLPPPMPQYASSIFNQHDGYDDKKYDKLSSTYYVPQTQQQKPGTTIIHNNLHLGSSSDERNDQVDSYGQKIHTYPPLPSYQYFSEGSAEVQDHSLGNRYENNQLVTIRPSKGYDNYHHQPQPTYHTTTTSRPYISDTGSTLTDYYTPSPHLDESNVNSVFQMERYPTVNFGSYTGRPIHSYPTKSHKRPDAPPKSQFYQNSYPNSYYPDQQSILHLFPTHIDPSKVKIRPNSQKLESMEQETGDDTDNQQDEDDQSAGTANGYNVDDSQSETYNRYNANQQIMASQLAQYVEQLNGNIPQAYGNNNPTPSSFQQQLSEDESQLGGYDGNLLTFDLFNRRLVPSASYDSSKPDPADCPVGVRQPNTTECTRYYVCSKEDGRVMEYTCPAYTAFNPQTRICDAHFYSICHPTAVLSRYTVSENRRIQLEALKALQDAKRIRDQALRAQNIALRLRLGEGDKNDKPSSTPSPQHSPQYSSEVLSNFLQNAIDSNTLQQSNGNGGTNSKVPSQSNAVTQRPNMYGSSGTSSLPTKRRKYYCKEGDKVADQTSIYNYFVCFKNSKGVMKGHKMTCSTGLLFCPTTSMCTLSRKCSS